ncbi:MAG TPA: prepilin-type N-terminal cleavage/methylation domain-containing protein [Acidimicrobiia bacterium]|jgi:prepilin-type N-terminal cleavage/methylation domain-containing protein
MVRRRRSERGFTLVELVTAVTVLALVMGPLATAVFLVLQHGGEATASFADDSTVRSATALFVGDAQTADAVALADPTPCGGTGGALVTTSWDDAGTVYRASWFAEPGPGNTNVLVRRRCTGTTLVSTVVLGDVASAPVVSCAPTCATPDVLTLSGTTASGSAFTITAHPRAS